MQWLSCINVCFTDWPTQIHSKLATWPRVVARDQTQPSCSPSTCQWRQFWWGRVIAEEWISPPQDGRSFIWQTKLHSFRYYLAYIYPGRKNACPFQPQIILLPVQDCHGACRSAIFGFEIVQILLHLRIDMTKIDWRELKLTPWAGMSVYKVSKNMFLLLFWSCLSGVALQLNHKLTHKDFSDL